VGKTGRALALRWREHVRQSQKTGSRTGYIHRAMNKHGPDAFTMGAVTAFDDPVEATKYEKRLLRQLRERGFRPYNLTLGGEGSDPGWQMTAEVLAQKSQAQRERMAVPENRNKIAAALRGRKRPPEVVAKVARARKGQRLTDEAGQRRRVASRLKAADPAEQQHLQQMALTRWAQFRAGNTLVGHQFGALTVENRNEEHSSRLKESVWICRCTCTRVVNVRGYNLRNGHTRTCGDKGCPEKQRVASESLKKAWALRRAGP